MSVMNVTSVTNVTNVTDVTDVTDVTRNGRGLAAGFSSTRYTIPQIFPTFEGYYKNTNESS